MKTMSLLGFGCTVLLLSSLLACTSTPVGPQAPAPTNIHAAPAADPTAEKSVDRAVEPPFQDIARNLDGSPRYMNQDDAFTYCAKIGAHLPSVREYAQWSHARGAKGILETDYKDVVYTDARVVAERDRNGKNGFFVIYRQLKDSRMVVDFYYNRNGYQRPAGDLGDTWFWTSDQFPADSGLAFVYDAPAGVVHYGFYHAKWYPIRCVNGRSK